MHRVTAKCDLQVWVCVNERLAGDPLPSCLHDRGMRVFELLRNECSNLATRTRRRIWVNRSLCQGFCHKDGVTVLVEPLGLRWQAVQEKDVGALVAELKAAWRGSFPLPQD